MMTDTIIANLPADGLRVVVRSLLVLFPEITGAFEQETKKYITQKVASSLIPKDANPSLVDLGKTQQIARSMLGCGLSFQSLELFQNLVSQGAAVLSRTNDSDLSSLEIFLASVDGDIVQAMTAVQKSLFIDTGARVMNDGEHSTVKELYQSLMDCHDTLKMTNRDFPFGRGLVSTTGILGLPRAALQDASQGLYDQIALAQPPPQAQETFKLNGRNVPRIFSGLWQMSSPAWGAASTSKIVEQFSKHVQQGFTAFDMADHYGDAEVVFYDNPDYLQALQFLAEDSRVAAVGLCNFDTKHLLNVVESGIRVHTNQVQFSLVDSRPIFEMGSACEKHDIKLLTYGTLVKCGGFLADKWLGKAEPDVYDGSITPSQRKVKHNDVFM
ncbi:hypothetical protein ACHAPV_006899 [Trichoderma viride]